MYTIFDAHPFTLCVIIATVMVTPFYMLAVYVFSKASPRKGIITGTGFLLWGAVMTWVCLTKVPMILAPVGSAFVPLGYAIVPLAWITPSLLLILVRNWFLSGPLSQRMLVGLQLVRVIGGVFLVEMTRNNIPGIFAYPAGLGDI
nr:hypothetical protein [Pseudomonadota bacterium]